MTDKIDIQIVASLADISATDWDACAAPETGRPIDPFTTHRFLKAIEDSGSVGPDSGWHPSYLVARQGDVIIAVAPLYGKTHSQGEYIFDHNWAHAYENAGGDYYPKLQMTVPFTPATGRRMLVRDGFETIGQSALIQGAVQLASNNGISSLHITFCTEFEAKAGVEMGLAHRVTQQFHWENDGYEKFDGFLGALSARKRKNIRKERRVANDFGGSIICLTGDQIKPEHWDAFWEFYQNTGARKYGTPYLTRAFFDIAQDRLRDDILLVLAERNGEYVAGALNFIGRDTLYGRYWGATEHHPCLHFELCYYRAIDYAIAHGLSRVEAGAQGEHKLARGYMPSHTHSLHWFGDKGFSDAINRYLVEERRAIDHDVEILTDYGPFKRDTTDHERPD